MYLLVRFKNLYSDWAKEPPYHGTFRDPSLHTSEERPEEARFNQTLNVGNVGRPECTEGLIAIEPVYVPIDLTPLDGGPHLGLISSGESEQNNGEHAFLTVDL